jgi:hypothetical protein
VLAYTCDASNDRVVYERTSEGIRIEVYRPGRWWRAVAEWILVLLVPVFCLAPGGGRVAWAWWIAGAVLAVAAAGEAARRLTRPVLIELTARHLRFRNLGGGAGGRNSDLRRDAVCDIRSEARWGRLLVWVRDSDIFECGISADPLQALFVADLLRDAMGWEGEKTNCTQVNVRTVVDEN